MKTLLIVLLAFGGGFAFKIWMDQKAPNRPRKAERKILYWHDPMHPAYRSDKPGIAPDCGMQLTPVYADEQQPAAERKVLYYRDPHQPGFKAENPGMNPETGNDLVPVYEGDEQAMPAGTVQIAADKQQLLNVTFGTVEYSSPARTIRAAGRIQLDERRISHVHTRVEGWIDQVFADFTGKYVEKGQPLATLYSPEMLATQQEYLLALKARMQLSKSTVAGVPDNMIQLVEASRRRLELWDLSEAQIESITRTGKPVKNITIYAPASGYVMERKAFPNLQVKPDTDLYTIADLDHVWIVADVFEMDAPAVRVGVPATISAAYEPGRKVQARVTYVLPQVDPLTRTMKVRLEAANPGGRWKPDMYVDVEFALGGGPRLTVPAEAVLDSGERKTVFVDRGNGYFEPRRVEIGERFDNRIEIRSGLKAGERIVTSGNFLIDSESQMKSAAEGHQHD